MINKTLLERWDPRYKIIALMLLTFSFSAVSRLEAIPFMLGLVWCFWMLSSVTLSTLILRLRYPSLLILLVILILLLGSRGNPLLSIGFLTVTYEGLSNAILVSSRFYSILTLAIVFLGSTPLLTNIRALQALGVPYIITDMALLMARYLNVLQHDLGNLKRSMCLRGFRLQVLSRNSIQGITLMTGNLLIRSFEQSQRVYLAMRLRGYGQQATTSTPFSANFFDSLALLLIAATAFSLGWLG